MRLASASTRAWKSPTRSRSTATVKNVRRPARYSRSSCRARSAWARARAELPWSPRPGWSRTTPRSVASILNLSASFSRPAGRVLSPPRRRSDSFGGASGLKNSSSIVSIRSMSLFLQRFLQDCFASRELTLDRVDGDPSDGRELPVPETVHVMQREQHARLARHRVQRARQVQPLDRRAASPPRQLFGRRAAPPAQLVDADVREHAIEPRGHGPPADVRLARFERLQQRSLDGVLRVGPVPQQAVGHRVQPGGIFFGGAGERAFVHLEQLYAR